MRRRSLAAAAALAALAAPPTVSAAEHEVVAAQGNVFRPADLTVAAGDTVVFRNTDPNPFPHNVKFDDGSFEEPAAPSSSSWRTSPKAFPNAGVFRYYCEQHGGPNGSGMAGKITVTQAGGSQPPPQPTLVPPPIVDSLRARRGRGGSIVVRVDPSFESTVTLTLARKVGRRYRRVTRIRKKLRRATRFTIKRDSRGRRLKSGRYRATARLKASSGATGPPRNAFVTLL